MTAVARALRDLPRHLFAIRDGWHATGAAASKEPLFVAAPSYSREAICAEPGIVGRIGITNHTLDDAHDCELALVTCSFEIPGLSLPSALPVKGSISKFKTDIKSGNTEYFDLFGALLDPAIDWPERTFLWVRNCPYVPRMEPTSAIAVFSLTGSNFPSQLWKGNIQIDQGDARLTHLVDVNSSV